MKPPARSEEGYTLTEMLVVIGIIGLIAAVLTPTVMGQMSRARAKTARLQMETVAASLEMYLADVGRYPTQEEGMAALVSEPNDAAGWTGPYLRDRKSVNDPWGRPLRYQLDSEGRAFTLISLGADGKEGGRGAAADIQIPEPAS
ncbi:MAG TPA: type II secretion system major pseudopilin GspG [Reyranella sp.]|nr:type II secretion system major pseudopilin GspG [Reyranella sp.]